MGRAAGVFKPWHVRRDASGTWEALQIPQDVVAKRTLPRMLAMICGESDQLVVV
jgi:hypothetical protein